MNKGFLTYAHSLGLYGVRYRFSVYQVDGGFETAWECCKCAEHSARIFFTLLEDAKNAGFDAVKAHHRECHKQEAPLVPKPVGQTRYAS
jgi:hypothetical protein